MTVLAWVVGVAALLILCYFGFVAILHPRPDRSIERHQRTLAALKDANRKT